MPGNVWTAPVEPLTYSSATPAVAAAATDLSPLHPVLLPGMLNVGTRIRVKAYGEYVAASGVSGTETLSIYMNQVGTTFSTTPAILAASGANTLANTATGTSWPWMVDWEGVVQQITDPAQSLSASVKGMGNCFWPTSVSAWTASPIPNTAAGRTVAQTATGLLTNVAQYIAIVGTLSTTTNVTSVTCDELTCELLG